MYVTCQCDQCLFLEGGIRKGRREIETGKAGRESKGD